MAEELAKIIVSFIVGGLITFFINNLAMRKMMVEIAKETARPMIDRSINEHEKSCQVPQDVKKIKMAVSWLVMKNGGDLRDLGLID